MNLQVPEDQAGTVFTIDIELEHIEYKEDDQHDRVTLPIRGHGSKDPNLF